MARLAERRKSSAFRMETVLLQNYCSTSLESIKVNVGYMHDVSLSERLKRENLHGKVILDTDESNWGWNTPAGILRKKRRATFLTSDFVGLPANPRVLEVGCGTGTFTDEISRKFKSLTCIDISDYLLEEAKKRFPAVSFVKGDIHKTEFPDESFDLVLGCSVLHHLDWNLALSEIHRILKPGGQLRFSEPNLLNPQIFLQKNWPWLKNKMHDSPDEYAFTSNQIRAGLEKASFTSISTEPFDFLHPAIPTIFMNPLMKIEPILEKTFLKHIAGSIKIKAFRS
jgi:ubiquinone/menaquinone biosynthesis C-methylase UbiE